MNPRHATAETVIGEITLVADGDEVVGLYFPHHWYRPGRESLGQRVDLDADPLLADTSRQVCEYLAGSRRAFDLPVRTNGDDFQEHVWSLLREIPYGLTTTYGALADRLGDAALAQRVGQAVGRNPLSVIVPCHRVVGKDGRLSGYAGGPTRKRFLLELERAA